MGRGSWGWLRDKPASARGGQGLDVVEDRSAAVRGAETWAVSDLRTTSMRALLVGDAMWESDA